MKVLVDTSGWSLALMRRRSSSDEAAKFSKLVEQAEVELIKPEF